MGRYNWEIAILKCIKSLGGEAELQRIYERIANFVELQEEHLRETYGRPAYHHQVRSHIKNLCESGELIQKDRGVYALTERGLQRANTPEAEVV